MQNDAKPHLIVPFAGCTGDGWLEAVTALELKTLGRLLQGMKLIETDAGQAESQSPPSERVQAKALGISAGEDGLIPWAAFEANAKPNEAWAFITPCHWAMGREHATLTDPATLELDGEQSRTLLSAMQPYFSSEGITLHYAQPSCWLARGDVFRSLPTASLDRVLGRNVDKWLPSSKAIKLLQNEMQMLLYTHPVNDDRTAKGQRAVNSFWLSGTGALTGTVSACPHICTARGLAMPALAEDWPAYSKAWVNLEATDISLLLAQQNSGQTVRLSLCGESNALTFQTTQHGFLTKLKNVLSPQSAVHRLKQL